jgi:hypothetical protein
MKRRWGLRALSMPRLVIFRRRWRNEKKKGNRLERYDEAPSPPFG